MLSALSAAGTDVFRLNFSHGGRDQHVAAAGHVRAIAAETGRNLALLQDLQGPKIRVGRFEAGSVELETGQPFRLYLSERDGDAGGVSLSYPDLVDSIDIGHTVLLDDGNIRLRIVDLTTEAIHTEVEVGGPLSDLKGITVPGAEPALPALTEKDMRDIELGVELDVDWVAQSFVQRADDLKLARHYLGRFGSTARLMAKIETPAAVARFDEILAAADGIMVARGDLGVEMPPEEVPVVQKRLVECAHDAGKPVVTATQMLESMVHNPRPTRAETSDVANAIFDGTDAVMLSAETAIGAYPVESVAMMRRVAAVVESSPLFEERRKLLRPDATDATPSAIAHAACEVAESLSARAILVFTAGGSSALRVARNRPAVPVLALTPSPKVRATLALSFGVRAELAPGVADADQVVSRALEAAREHGLAAEGDRIVITAGVPFGVTGTTNMVWVERVR